VAISKDVKEFAMKVERLCDYLLDKIDTKDGSNDIKFIQDLKEDAANFQFQSGLSIVGLYDYVNGVSEERK
jgi:hypothetical protein